MLWIDHLSEISGLNLYLGAANTYFTSAVYHVNGNGGKSSSLIPSWLVQFNRRLELSCILQKPMKLFLVALVTDIRRRGLHHRHPSNLLPRARTAALTPTFNIFRLHLSNQSTPLPLPTTMPTSTRKPRASIRPRPFPILAVRPHLHSNRCHLVAVVPTPALLASMASKSARGNNSPSFSPFRSPLTPRKARALELPTYLS